ncbi:replication initiation protein [Phaeobacter inhibens]|uniref:replication initiation protein n=1 Tax=Phaeobacter inhibens TaxID=221822 RepID=UPI002490462B|nr:replication initiation protein [Phaeobacter inhibens]
MYPAFGALNKHVMKPAVDEINALAPLNIQLIPMKAGKRVSGVRVGWWRKSEEELKEAWAEAQRSRVGRKARITGRVEHVSPMPSISFMARKARLDRRAQVPHVWKTNSQKTKTPPRAG